MKKYAEIARITWKSMMAYNYDVFAGAAFSICKIILAWLMWRVIFSSREQVGGYDFAAMMTYYIIASFLGRLDQSGSLNSQFCGEIRNGQFGKYIVRPMRPVLYFLSCSYAKAVYVFGVNFVATAAWALIFFGQFRTTPRVGDWCLAALIFLLGMNFMTLFNYYLSILCFRFVNIDGLNILKVNLVEFISGALVPLSIFPAAVTKAFSLLPFYYTVYYPASLLTGRSEVSPLVAVALMLFWNVVIIAVSVWQYGKSVRKFEGAGI